MFRLSLLYMLSKLKVWTKNQNPKKETIQKILPLPVKSKYLIHDHWIGLIASLNGKVVYMPEKYIKYRQHGNNQVGTDKISHGFKKIEQVRELFVNVKLDMFHLS